MSRPMIKIHNATTDEIVEREMNDEELAAYEKIIEERKMLLKEEKKKEIAKQELLEKLGISEQEMSVLLG